MNKKFLSAVLSASMLLAPLGGNSCFADVVIMEEDGKEIHFNCAKAPDDCEKFIKTESTKLYERAVELRYALTQVVNVSEELKDALIELISVRKELKSEQEAHNSHLRELVECKRSAGGSSWLNSLTIITFCCVLGYVLT